MQALADRQVPALVLRNAYNPEHCTGLMQRFSERGYFNQQTVGVESQLNGGPYLDLGTSLGRVGADPEAFFAHAERTHALFSHLFDGFANNAVVGQLEDMNICSAYGASVDLSRGVDDYYTIWNKAM